jgi:signal peptidase I
MDAVFENLFAWILLLATVITGVAYVYDTKVLLPKRKQVLEGAKKAASEQNKPLSKKECKKMLEPNTIVGQAGSLFTVILFVFIFRSFIVEPFRIPSGSMQPTLEPGDFIVVSKLSYGIRNPLTNNVLIDTSAPERGDVIVFKYPKDKTTDYIKRVIGLPGDTVIYQDKHLYLLKADAPEDAVPELITMQRDGTKSYETMMGFDESYEQYAETFEGIGTHKVLIDPNAARLPIGGTPEGHFKVPENCYFVMGDNRDHSADSRFWGFVPFENIVGKTKGIWLSLEFNRKSDDALPTWIPSAVRFDRIGGID